MDKIPRVWTGMDKLWTKPLLPRNKKSAEPLYKRSHGL